ncbi:MAG: DUF1611 domain-containing protein, partial [Thermoplasmata archaeon]
SGHPIAGISLNTERMNEYEVHFYINEYERKYGVPVDAPLYTGVNKLARTLIDMLSKEKVNVYARGGY